MRRFLRSPLAATVVLVAAVSLGVLGLRSLADPILRKTAPNEPMNEPTVTSAIDDNGVVTSGYPGRARLRPA